MKRVAIFVAVVTAELLMLTAIASAAPPDCDERPDHPRCSTTTTTTTEPPIAQPCETVTSLTVTNGQHGFECEWTPEFSSNETGTVTVETVSGEITRLVIFVRDSSPGDICVLNQLDKPIASVVEATFPLVDDEGVSYWDSPTHWCERFDPVAGQRTDLNGDPLHLRINFRAKRGTDASTEVLISLSPGQAGNE
jgi:hypothetical protein